MKESSGEFSMTIIVIVAAVAILGIVTGILIPRIGDFINDSWNDMTGTEQVIIPVGLMEN